ncbi:MAG TPA: beta-ketoacyl-ACP synthase III [Tissierellaceae bacterium]|nr:beta-ketoacyl-ACP synthase III [Tissierellaceae bacterium]
MENFSVGISGTGSYVPEDVLTNDDLSKMVDTSHEWIVSRTGIEERRIISKDMANSDLCTEAAKKALKDANLKAEEIDLIIVATITPDYPMPATACIVQKNIGAINAAAFDLNAGCTGFVYALTTGANFIKAGMYKKALIIGGEALSRIINWEDRNTCVLFGDGAGACVLERCEEDYGILAYELGSDGDNYQALIQPGGGSKEPASVDSLANDLHYIHMDGKEVFKFAVRAMEKSSINALKLANMDVNDLDYLVPHQANIRIIDSARKKLNLEKEKVYVNLNKYGNMSSASIPVALDEALRNNRIKKGDIVLLVAFGAGLTWGSVILRWNKEE